MRVLIVGAGLGGLCLAHGLHKAGIDVQVFERQKDDLEKLAGYGIHVNAQGKRALQKCIPTSSWARFEAASISAGTQMFFRGTELQLLAEKDDAKITGAMVEEVERRGIGRSELRQILLDGLSRDGITRVHWNKSFTHFCQHPNGKVGIYFADNTSEEGDVLVGADGARSAIREQYLPHVQRLELGIHAIAGRCVLNDNHRARLPADMINGSLNNIVPRGKGWMFVSSWALPTSNRVDKVGKGVHHIVWAYVVPAEDESTALSSLEPSALKEFVLHGIEGWSYGLKAAIADSDPSMISCIALRSMPLLEEWAPSSVTVIGDAIHNMTPMAGVGANTAFRDAELLTEMLAQAASGEISINDAIGSYERKMRVYANEAVGLSKRNAVSASSGRGFQRWMFRMILKAAQVSPLIMRGTIGRGAMVNQ